MGVTGHLGSVRDVAACDASSRDVAACDAMEEEDMFTGEQDKEGVEGVEGVEGDTSIGPSASQQVSTRQYMYHKIMHVAFTQEYRFILTSSLHTLFTPDLITCLASSVARVIVCSHAQLPGGWKQRFVYGRHLNPLRPRLIDHS